MPITGISNVLENMLVSVLNTHSLKTWNIFHEENGQVTFRLKFSSIEDIPMSNVQESRPATTVSFRRKSANQIVRDKARLSKRRRVSSSHSNVLNASNEDIEVIRSQSESDLDNIDLTKEGHYDSELCHASYSSTPLSILHKLEIPTCNNSSNKEDIKQCEQIEPADESVLEEESDTDLDATEKFRKQVRLNWLKIFKTKHTPLNVKKDSDIG